MPPAEQSGRRARGPRHGGPDPQWGGPAAVDPGDDAYGDVTGERPRPAGRHGAPEDGRPADPLDGGFGVAAGRRDEHRPTWPPPTALPSGPPRERFADGVPESRFGPAESRPAGDGAWPSGRPPLGQAPPSPPYGQASPGSSTPPPGYPTAPGGVRPNGRPSPGQGPAPYSNGWRTGGWPTNGHGTTGQAPTGQAPTGQAPTGQAPTGQAPTGQPPYGQPPRSGAEPTPTAVQPADTTHGGTREQGALRPGSTPLLAGGIPPPSKDEPRDAPVAPSDAAETTTLGPNSGKHRRGAAATGPGRGDDEAEPSGRRSRSSAGPAKGTKKKRKGSFWRELPLLVVVAIVLTFVIQTFVARIYVIPSASMEQTLHGCTGCANDRVAVDKVSYRFGDPAPGDVVVFKGPPAWLDNGEVGDTAPSGNPLVRGFQDALSLVGLAAPNEKDFVKRVIAVGGQTIACCDPQNRVLVDNRPINEPYLYYQPGLGNQQATFDPVRVPDGQIWVMGDNRNNSADARFHGPVPLSDVIGKVRVVVLPITRWRTVPAINPQTTTGALGSSPDLQLPGGGLPDEAPAVAGTLLAVPVVWGGRRLRHAARPTTGTAPPEPGPDDRREGSAAEAGPGARPEGSPPL